jgi:hypothetical protein
MGPKGLAIIQECIGANNLTASNPSAVLSPRV